jgi:hypothetical protein
VISIARTDEILVHRTWDREGAPAELVVAPTRSTGRPERCCSLAAASKKPEEPCTRLRAGANGPDENPCYTGTLRSGLVSGSNSGFLAARSARTCRQGRSGDAAPAWHYRHHLVPITQVEKLANKLEASGIPFVYAPFKGGYHGYDMFTDTGPGVMYLV